MRVLIIAMAMIALGGCAATYMTPQTPNQSAVAQVAKPKAEILAAARRALVANGYQITAFDDASGIVSTAPRDLRIYPEQADCGTTMGIDYLKDVRTTTRVGFGIIATDQRIEVRANIEGEYKPGSAQQNITLTCVSRGVLDQEMLAKIKANL